MDISIYDRLRPYLSKLIAAGVVPLLAWAAGKTGWGWFNDPEFVESVNQIIVVWLTATIVHTAAAKHSNPGNSASAHHAKAEAVKTAVLKGDVPTYITRPMDDVP